MKYELKIKSTSTKKIIINETFDDYFELTVFLKSNLEQDQNKFDCGEKIPFTYNIALKPELADLVGRKVAVRFNNNEDTLIGYLKEISGKRYMINDNGREFIFTESHISQLEVI